MDTTAQNKESVQYRVGSIKDLTEKIIPWKICVKSTLALIIYLGAVFTAHNMLNALALPQTTDVDEIARKNFLGSQALAVLNSTLPDNLLIYG